MPDLAATPGQGLSPLLRVLLHHRGVRSETEATSFLDGALADGHDPLLMPGMPAAVERLVRAVRGGEMVAIFGDYDVDGMTATALLTEGLRDLGAHVLPHIPDRFRDGYGLNTDSIGRLRAAGAALLVSVDCGITAHREIRFANDLGFDVVVLDHHTVPEELPPAVAAVDPKFPGSPYPCTELTSAGLVFKLLLALYASMGRTLDEERLLDLVALGTVADVAPLQGENRHLVKRGLRALHRTSRPGLRALLEVAGIAGRPLGTDDLGFGLGPRLNAAGRLGDAGAAFELLMTRDEGRGRELAERLDVLNRERQRQTDDAMALATEALGPGVDDPLVFVSHPRISSGIVGIIAGRLSEQYYRPAVVCEEGEAESRGSARSIPEFHITYALRAVERLLLRYGGHRQAAGLTFANEHGPAIREELREQAARDLQGIELAPAIHIDARIKLARLKGADVVTLSRLEPFGDGNPRPTFLSQGVEVIDARPIGDGSHARLRLRDGRITWPAVAWRTGRVDSFPDRLDIVYSVGPDSGYRDALQIEVHDMRASEMAPPATV